MKYCVVVYVGKIYVVGGVCSNRFGYVLRLVECYSFEENCWISVCDMLIGRFDYQCYVVKVGYRFIVLVMEKFK